MPGCHRQSVPVPSPALIQLRRRYSASCSSLQLSVETDPAGWLARVSNCNNGPALYSAYRSSLGAAKVAAAEFALFSAGVGDTPEFVAQRLGWQESW